MHNPSPPHRTEQLIDTLLSHLQLTTTTFHVGTYCGRWDASTSGTGAGSFHLILHGTCYLHLQDQPPVELHERDAVYLLQDIPHFLSAEPSPQRLTSRAVMQPLSQQSHRQETSLACGFFQFQGSISELILGSLPPYLIIRADDKRLGAASALFDLILAEPATNPDTPSPLIARLVETMLFYVLRHLLHEEQDTTSLLTLARRPEFTALLERLLREPGRDWSTAEMADTVHMSRTSFYKNFISTCGQPPAQFLLTLRMQIAARQLDAGLSIDRTAEHVGYKSYAAFSRAFKKIIGAQPGAYRRALHRTVDNAMLN